MAKTNKKSSAKRKLIPAVSMLTVSAVMLSTATYAWFTMSKEVEVKNIRMTATVPEDIQISLGAITNPSESVSLAKSTGFLTGTTATTPASPYDWANIADVSQYYAFGKLIPASSNNGVNIFYTPDAAGVGRTMKSNAGFYQAAEGKTEYGTGTKAAVADGKDGAAATAHIYTDAADKVTTGESPTGWAVKTRGYTKATAWNTTNDDGYYVDIPVWLRTSSTNAQNIYVSGFVTDNNEENNNDSDDLYKAVRVAILSTSTENNTESYSANGGCLTLADGGDTLVEEDTGRRNAYPQYSNSNNILDSDNYSATGTDNKSGNNAISGRMNNPDGKIYGISAINANGAAADNTTWTVITENNGTETVAQLPATQSAGQFGAPVKLIVRVWLEGEDGNCWNENAGQDWNISLKFSKEALTTPQQGG